MKAKIAIVGAGPGGICAAVKAAENGAGITLIDDNPALGGQIWRQKLGKVQDRQAKKLIDRLLALDINYLPGTTACSSQSGVLKCINHLKQGSDIEFDSLILANGARELFLPFPGWTLPGVFGCGGLQALAKSGLDVRGKRVVIAGSGPLLLAVSAYLKQHGANLCGIYEQAAPKDIRKFGAWLLWNQSSKILQGISYRFQTLPAPLKLGWWVKEAHGSETLKKVSLTNGSDIKEVECDYLACGFGLIPNSELAQSLNCESHNGFISVNDKQETSVSGIYAVGELTGIGGLDKALLEGEIAALSALGLSTEHISAAKRKSLTFTEKLNEAYKLRKEVKSLADKSTVFCRCEDVSFGEVCDYKDQRAAKLYTRCGMGACQGRICTSAGQEILGWQKNKIKSPVIPVEIDCML